MYSQSVSISLVWIFLILFVTICLRFLFFLHSAFQSTYAHGRTHGHLRSHTDSYIKTRFATVWSGNFIFFHNYHGRAARGQMRRLPAASRLLAVRPPASYSSHRRVRRPCTQAVLARCRRSKSPRYTSCAVTDTSCASVHRSSVRRNSGSCPTTENMIKVNGALSFVVQTTLLYQVVYYKICLHAGGLSVDTLTML